MLCGGEILKKWWNENGFSLSAAILAIMIFVGLYGVQILDVTYDDWLMTGGDLSQHYLGWRFFRESDWFFPIGLMDRIAYPNLVSIIFTDSIPLMAVLFKIFRNFLPDTFQYFGIWGMGCFGIQGMIGALLLNHFCKNKSFSVVGSLFFVIAPIEIYRMFMHTALGAQWLLLWAFLIGVKRKELSFRQKILAWIVLGFLCGSIHLYFVPMCGLIMCAFLLVELIEKRHWMQCIVIGAGYCVAVLGTVILLGGLSHDHQLDAGGLGQFSFNLNGFINPQGWSSILPDLPLYGDGAGEGLAFLGIGVLFLFLTSIVGMMISKLRGGKVGIKADGNLLAFSIIGVGSIIVSVSHELSLGNRVVWEIPYPEELVSLWGMFRSSGRFIWPAIYLLTLCALVLTCRIAENFYFGQIVTVFVGGCLFLQVVDCFPQLEERHIKFSNRVEYQSVLQDERWDEWAKEKKHLVFVSNITENQGLLYSLADYALKNDMTINDFYFAHSAIKADIAESLAESLENPTADYIYIYKETDEDLCVQKELEYQGIDGIIVGVLNSN